MPTKTYQRYLDSDYRLDVEIDTERGNVCAYRVSLEYDSGDEWVRIGRTQRSSSRSRESMEQALQKARGRLIEAFEGHRMRKGLN